jgi:thiamine-phosphate pyrophosphorylase
MERIATRSLARTAATLGRRAARGKAQGRPRLPSLWFVTDPGRTPDPDAIIAALPAGAGVIYRAFGAADALETAKRLRRLTDAQGLVLLVGADERLAALARADGVHLPERMLSRARRLRARHPLWLITGAAHSPRALALADRAGLDAALVSAIFRSNSPSAGAPMGPLRLARLVRGAWTPVIALGGVNTQTAPRLISTGAYGLAAVEGWSGARPRT